MANTLYELDVRLRGIEPPIWRTIELAGDSTLEDVHYAIQAAMGWTNSHLHHFLIEGKRYAMREEDEFSDLDETQFDLQSVAREGASLLYEYDFGDAWEHEVTVLRVSASAKPVRPRCTGGARACPPEDCGGPLGYAELVVAISDPLHERHRELRDWTPRGFHPEAFRVPKQGRELQAMIDEYRRHADGEPEEPAGRNDLGSLPRSLVDAVLALDPMQRASLAGLIAASLGHQLVEARAQVLAARPRSSSGNRTRSRKAH